MLFSLLFAVLPAQFVHPPAKDEVQVHVAGALELLVLRRNATDVDDHQTPTADGWHTIYADDAEQTRLADLGLELRVVREDLSRFYAERAANDAQFLGGSVGSMGGFRTLAEIGQEMDRLAADYPAICSQKFVVGTSHEGRPIWAMRVSNTPNSDDPSEPLSWYDGIHHAREPMSGESVLQFASWLCAGYDTGPERTRLVDTRNLLFIPCSNPDGYEYNRQTDPNGGGTWRKNRRVNGGGSFGVDLNRNYAYEWGPQWPGSSGNSDSDVYRGPAPFSEPETLALSNFFALHPATTAISAHCFSDVWLFPWGYDEIYTPDHDRFNDYGLRMTASTGWPYGAAWEVLYVANGVTIDWHYGEYGCFSYTPEIGGQGDGFWPSPSRISALFEDVRPGYLLNAQVAGGWVELSVDAPIEVVGDGDPWPEGGETWDYPVALENIGLAAAIGDAALSSSDPEVTVLSGVLAFNLAPHGSSQAGAFRLQFAAGATGGHVIELALTWEGKTSESPFQVLLGQPRLLVHDAMEDKDFGWQSNNQTNWSWERANPEATMEGGETVQPESDNPDGVGSECWVTGAAAGGGAGTNDVDGTAVLTSPRFRASGFSHLELEYARWFANLPGGPLDDVMLVEVSSDDGQNWMALEAPSNDNEWRSVSFALEQYVALSDEMRLRVTVADDPNNDLTEGLLDDLKLRTRSALPTLGLWGETALGNDFAFFIDAPAGLSYHLLWSFDAGAGTTLPGVDGELFLSGGIRTLRTGSMSGGAFEEILTRIPPNPALQGLSIHLQVWIDEGGAQAALSNLYTFTIE